MGVVKKEGDDSQSAWNRAFRVGRMGMGVAGSYLGYQFQNLFFKEGQFDRRKSFHERTSKRVRQELESLKGPAMKVGQMLSMQSHALPEEALIELSRLQMNAPAMHASLARAQFKASTGRYPEEVFRSFQTEPIAAASLGQVHEAVTRRGKKAAVKIQYPAIRKAIENDLKLFKTAAYPVKIAGVLNRADFEEIERQLLQETDYQ